MNKIYVKRILSLVLVLLLVFPAIGLASVPSDLTIKSVYFQDEKGNMVFVDYETAIQQSLEENHVLYNAIKKYVGEAEIKGRLLYVQTSTGKLLDYGKAMRDNLFTLQEIIGKEKYEINQEIKYTHELKVVDGSPIISEIKEVNPPVDPVELVGIESVDDITVEFGTSLDKAIGLLAPMTTMMDSNRRIHSVKIEWGIENYDGNVAGNYSAVGSVELPQGVNNNRGLELKVRATVTVKPSSEPEPNPEFPVEIEDVFVGISQITNNTYANIKIKSDYVSVVEAVYLDEILANNIEGDKSQWRIEVEAGTTVENLKGRISVTMEEGEEVVIVTEFKEDVLLGEGFGLGELVVSSELTRNYKNATQYKAVYTVGRSTTTVTTDMAKLGDSPKDLVQSIKDINSVSIILYDASGNEIVTMKDVMNR